MSVKRLAGILIALSLCLSGCLSAGEAPIGTVAPSEATTESTQPPTTLPEVTLPDYVEVFREGEVSKIPVETVRGTVGNYLIAMEPEYFVFTPRETADFFTYENWPGDMAVYFCISGYAETDPQVFLEDMIGLNDQLYQAVNIEETTIGSYPATAIYLRDYQEDPAYQKHIFFIRCDSGNYLLEAQFTSEMYEGLYAIMQALFDTFTVF